MFYKISRALKKNNKGFTLVELMVVVVIIGVLVAIAIPIYNNVTDTARDKADEANVRTIKGAVQMYASTQGGQLPSVTNQVVNESSILKNYLDLPLYYPGTTNYYKFSVTDGVITASQNN